MSVAHPPRLHALAIAALATTLAGCQLEPGNWFLNLSPRLSAQYLEVPERAIEPGWQKLASEYQVRVTTAELHIRKIDLIAAPASAAAFDPANPPPGYSLCHNGHCHAADGRLVAYDDIVAATKGTAVTVALSLGGGVFNLLIPPTATPLTCAPPSACQSGETRITRASITVDRLRLQGEVRDGPGVTVPIGASAFSLDLVDAPTAPLPSLAVPLSLIADNRNAPNVTLTLSLVATAALLDGVVWSAHPASATGIDLGTSPQAPSTRASLTEALTRLLVRTDLQR